jgi:hypothetical protein
VNTNHRLIDYDKVVDRLPDQTVFLGYRGSQAHGTWLPKELGSIDDIDLMGVYVGPVEHYLAFGRPEVAESFIDEYDIVSYELRKFVHLLYKNNPNVLSMLWLDDAAILRQGYLWQDLVKNRNLFVSKTAYHSFTGYAYAQLKKMTAFNEKEQQRVLKLEQVLLANGITFGDGKVPKLPAGATKDQIEAVRQYNEVRSKYFSGYMGDKRKSNVIKYGYDTKNAAHLIRLLRMSCEFLRTGEFIVFRPDADELKDIKQGAWSLADVHYETEGLFLEAKTQFEKSDWPETPDKAAIEKLLIKLICDYQGENFAANI